MNFFDFSQSRKKKNPIHVPIFKKIHRLEHTQETHLYRSKTVVFRDGTVHALRAYSSHVQQFL